MALALLASVGCQRTHLLGSSSDAGLDGPGDDVTADVGAAPASDATADAPAVDTVDATDAPEGDAFDGAVSGSPPTIISEGPSKLISLFATARGVIVVRASGAVLLSPSGATLARADSDLEVTAAAIDGARLAVADRAKVTPMTLDLQASPATLLTESCAGAMLAGGRRFVCGPATDAFRVFGTYDLDTRKQIASSEPLTYHGVPMVPVPGRDAFVTISVDTSPSDFFLHEIHADGKVTYVNESPYHGDFVATPVIAFDATPAVHLIQRDGLMLRIYGVSPACDDVSEGCFTKDGVLGTVSGGGLTGAGEGFVALADDGAGKLFGIVGQLSGDSPCVDGCKLQVADIAGRRALVDAPLGIADIESVVALAPAPSPAKQVYLGYRTKSSGYVVAVLQY